MTPGRTSYEVLIPYGEPTYEIRRPEGPRKRPYLSAFTVGATSEEEAIPEAVKRFKERARNSAVSWVREIDHAGIRVQRVDSEP